MRAMLVSSPIISLYFSSIIFGWSLFKVGIKNLKGWNLQIPDLDTTLVFLSIRCGRHDVFPNQTQLNFIYIHVEMGMFYHQPLVFLQNHLSFINIFFCLNFE